MNAEEWRPVAEFPGYDVSDQGRVRSWRTKRGPLPYVLSPGLNPKGYPLVVLQQDGRQRTIQVHRLVAEAFVGPRPTGWHTRHLDGNQQNNTAANLAYGTASDNERDKVRHGTHNTGNKTHCKHGHPFDEENTRLYRGSRYCRACMKRWNDELNARRKASRGASA